MILLFDIGREMVLSIRIIAREAEIEKGKGEKWKKCGKRRK